MDVIPEPPGGYSSELSGDVMRDLQERWELCVRIARKAYLSGLSVDPYIVNRHLKWFRLWYSGGMATGHLMGRTGVRFRKSDTSE